MFDFLDDVGRMVEGGAADAGVAVNDWLGQGADASGAVTAAGAGQHAAAAQPESWWGRLGQGIGDIGRGFEQEGLSGLLDPSGMIDRQQAQRDLSTRFQVLPDDFVGPRLSNQVSQAEYEQIAHTFSDVRMGRGDLRVDGSTFDGANADTERANYEQGAMDEVANMMMTTSGRRQIDNLSDNVLRDDAGDARRSLWGLGPEQHHQTTIVPLFGTQTVNPDGTTSYADPGAGNHTAANLRTDNGYADAVDRTAMLRQADGSRGDGTDVNIRWNPDTHLGARSDIILAHEMEHTINETQGSMATGTLGGAGPDAGFQNWERQAVGLTRSDSPTGGHYPGDPDGCTENTYRSERNQLGLGERWLPRERYGHLPGQAANDADLDAAWNRHNASGNAAP